MKAFTLDLSKEAMLLLQIKLPKGYSLVRATKESKKGARTDNFSNVSADSAKKEPKAQTVKMQNDQITSKKPEKSLKKSKEVFYGLF